MVPFRQNPRVWKAILDNMTEGIMLVENGGRILFVNRAMELLTGYSEEELVGQECALLEFGCCPRVPGVKKRGPCRLFAGGRLHNEHFTLKRKDGRIVTVLKNAQVVGGGDEDPVLAVEIQADASALQQRDEEISRLRSVLAERRGFHGIVGNSPPMRNLFDIITKSAASDAPVLIYGESGSGKELVATAIHQLGRKSTGPFIRVNCAALSESLLESELFGHVKGAFTGASRTSKGRFEAANHGDIFLDEIGDLSLSTQVKLLRVIQEKQFERVGDYRPISTDVRVIAATHRDLRALVMEGSFREDLFYRLNVIPIFIPPLRDRPEDVPLLLDYFIQEISARTGKRIKGVDQTAMDLLIGYSWPGNVRELMNVLEYAFVVCARETITRADLPDVSMNPPAVTPTDRAEPLGKSRKERLEEALSRTKGRKGDAARLLGVSRQTVWSWIKKYGVDVDCLRY